MRQQGLIDTWQDDRGFGFIPPHNGSQRVFVHIKSFSKRGRRPSAGSAVTYLVKRDRDGRLQAAQVAFANPAENAVTSPDRTFALLLAGPARRPAVAAAQVEERVVPAHPLGDGRAQWCRLGIALSHRGGMSAGGWQSPGLGDHLLADAPDAFRRISPERAQRASRIAGNPLLSRQGRISVPDATKSENREFECQVGAAFSASV
jgi:cold shock CspA family protein